MFRNNVDEWEIKKFNAHASYWWNSNNSFKVLHDINKTRLNYILQHSNGLFNKKVLDVGCGGGILSESMAQQGAKVVSLDMSVATLETAKSHALKKGLKIDYILETVETHAQNTPHYYDVVTCMEVLEHVPCPYSIIKACASVIKKGGSVFFSTLNRTFQSRIFIIIGAEYILHLIPKGTHNFNKFITPDELLKWIDTTSLIATNITGLYYNPITNICKYTANINTNYIFTCTSTV